MRPELDILIERFRRAQDLAVETLVHVLKVPAPESALAWARYCRAQRIGWKFLVVQDIPMYAHGYGVELKLDCLTIDFDWGPDGEPDGFDGWRLYWFSVNNATGIPCTHLEVCDWLDNSLENGELTKSEYLYSGCLYFDPRRRATPPAT